MSALMTYDDVAEHLKLDRKNEERDKLIMKAVFEEIALFVVRPLEYQEAILELLVTDELGIFTPRNYPVREFIYIRDQTTGKDLELIEGTKIPEIDSVQAFYKIPYRLAERGKKYIVISYMFGYRFEEMPGIIQRCVLDMVNDEIRNPETALERKNEHLYRLLPICRSEYV